MTLNFIIGIFKNPKIEINDAIFSLSSRIKNRINSSKRIKTEVIRESQTQYWPQVSLPQIAPVNKVMEVIKVPKSAKDWAK